MKFMKENLRVTIAVVIAAVVIAIVSILLLTDKNKLVEKPSKEDLITEITGMSSEDAIKIVKENFYNDNYEFKVIATNDNLYKVIAINKIKNSEIVYYVDPTNGMAYVDIDTN